MKIAYLALAVLLSGCTTLTPELIEALAKDSASFCARSTISGGAGAAGLLAGAGTGGYGQGNFAFCRANRPGAKVEIKPDGSMSIEHED